ncbi:MAG: hypothetical protein JSS76_00630 [Bacteroidetes bacterium]|nr:hypothetical protein [Bacteroidota bacterium]
MILDSDIALAVEIAIPICLLLWFTYWLINRTIENQQHWHHTFDGQQFSADEFYSLVQQHIEKREIPDIEFSRTTYTQKRMLSDEREYFHIEVDDCFYDVCAAPHGNCYFVSLWSAERPPVLKKILKRIPILKHWLESKSYHQIDTDSVTHNVIFTSFNEAIDAITTTKGLRALTKSEKKVVLN